METGQTGELGEDARVIAERQEPGLAQILPQQMEEQAALGLALMIVSVMEVLVVSCSCVLYYLCHNQGQCSPTRKKPGVALLSGKNYTSGASVPYIRSIAAIPLRD
jgi:hypothetical protein